MEREDDISLLPPSILVDDGIGHIEGSIKGVPGEPDEASGSVDSADEDSRIQTLTRSRGVSGLHDPGQGDGIQVGDDVCHVVEVGLGLLVGLSDLVDVVAPVLLILVAFRVGGRPVRKLEVDAGEAVWHVGDVQNRGQILVAVVEDFVCVYLRVRWNV